LKLGCCFHQPQ